MFLALHSPLLPSALGPVTMVRKLLSVQYQAGIVPTYFGDRITFRFIVLIFISKRHANETSHKIAGKTMVPLLPSPLRCCRRTLPSPLPSSSSPFRCCHVACVRVPKNRFDGVVRKTMTDISVLFFSGCQVSSITLVLSVVLSLSTTQSIDLFLDPPSFPSPPHSHLLLSTPTAHPFTLLKLQI